MLPEGTQLGNLAINEVFVDYDGPQLFSCLDDKGRNLLAVHAPAMSDEDNWLYVYIGSRRLKAVADGLVSLHAAFFNPQDGRIRLVIFDSIGKARVTSVKPEEIPGDWFPVEGERLGEPNNTQMSAAGIESVEQQVYALSLPEIPDFLRDPAPMWEISPELLDYLRSKRTPVAEVARRTGRSVIDFVFRTTPGRSEMPVDVLGNLLLAAQSTVEALIPVPSSGRVIGNIRSMARLDALPLFPGSFGIRLDTHESYLFPIPLLVEALQRIVNLLETATDPTAFRTLLLESGPKAAFKFRNLAQALERSDADVSIEVGIPTETNAISAQLTRKEVTNLVKVLREEAPPTHEEFTFRGQLVGVTIKTKFFALEDDERVVSGRIADIALASMFGKTIGDRYDADITAITDLNEATGQERVRNVLNGLKAIE